MAYYGSWKIDDLLTFVCNTHAASTGAASDADGAPTYRVYEDETATPILTGSMALLDDAGTLGYYSEQITLSAANGFEIGKSYNIYITATVSGVAGTMSHNFQMLARTDAVALSGDTGAADNMETMLDGTGGQALTLGQLRINSSAAGGGIDIDNSGGPGIDSRGTIGLYAQASGASNYGIEAVGTGATDSGGIKASSTTAGEGIEGIAAGNGHGMQVVGAGTGEGLHAKAGGAANGHGAHFEGVGVNSHGLLLTRGGTGGDDLSFANNDVTVANVTTVATATNVTTVNGLAANVITAAAIAADAIGASELAADAVAEIADAVWDELATGHTDAGKAGEQLWTDIDAILVDTGTTLDGRIPAALTGGKMESNIGTITAGAITAAAIATGAIDADALAADAIDEIWDELIGDSTYTARQAFKIMAAVLAGKTSGGGTSTSNLRNLADTTNVVVATTDANGNRTAVTITV